MRNLAFLNILIIITIFACKSKQSVVHEIQETDNDQAIQINMPAQISIGNNLKIEISTTLDEGVILFDPMLIRIERFENGEWKRVRILHCPCGANCEPPPRKKLISKNDTWSMSWNLVESWCENEKDQEIPKTIELPAAPGKYRSVFYYGYNVKERIKLTKEFQIKN